MSESNSSPLHPLVTQPLVDTGKFYCPFFDRGYCRESTRCNFSHDQYASIRIPNHYCHFYLANQCLYGQDCKFRHSEPSSVEQSPSTSQIFERLCIDETIVEPSTSRRLSSILGRNSDPLHENTNEEANEEGEGDDEQGDLDGDVDGGELGGDQSSSSLVRRSRAPTAKRNHPLCPYASTQGDCPFPQQVCPYVHGLVCDLCLRACLHPDDTEQQRQHREDCLREHEREMELSFAVQRSKDKVCGICMDIVVEKKPITSSRFGILEKCNHIFCLDCIRKWRGTKQFDNRTIRACPECRVSSDFVVPSKYWVEDQDDKEKLIRDYKAALKSKPCRYFDEGKGECPFAGSCFYKHAYPDGRLAKLEAPKPRRRLFGGRGHTTDFANYILWNVLTSADEDEWSNDESLYLDQDYNTSDEEVEDEIEFDVVEYLQGHGYGDY